MRPQIRLHFGGFADQLPLLIYLTRNDTSENAVLGPECLLLPRHHAGPLLQYRLHRVKGAGQGKSCRSNREIWFLIQQGFFCQDSPTGAPFLPSHLTCQSKQWTKSDFHSSSVLSHEYLLLCMDICSHTLLSLMLKNSPPDNNIV